MEKREEGDKWHVVKLIKGASKHVRSPRHVPTVRTRMTRGTGISFLPVEHRGKQNSLQVRKAHLGLVWFGLFRGSCHISWQFFHKQLDQRRACSAFLSPESLHDRDPQSRLDGSLRPGAPLSWKIILTL